MTAESRENIWLRVTTTSVVRAHSISSLILISLVIFSCHEWKINKKKQKKEWRGSINFLLLYKYYSFAYRKHTFSTAMLSCDMIISSRIINRVCWIWFTVSERLDGGWDDPSSRERASFTHSSENTLLRSLNKGSKRECLQESTGKFSTTKWCVQLFWHGTNVITKSPVCYVFLQ